MIIMQKLTSIVKYCILFKINLPVILRQIKKELNISMGTTQYHLEKLEKEGKITTTKKGLYKYYFPIGIFHETEKKIYCKF